MIYVVSGYRRSGTTAMMHALREGGMGSFITPEFLKVSRGVDGFMPLPTGCFELAKQYPRDPEFLRSMLELAKQETFCVKIFFDDILYLPAFDYRVVFMRRDTAEINKSCDTVNYYKEKSGVPINTDFRKPFDHMAPYNMDHLEHVIDICKKRRDMRVYQIWYSDLVDDPDGVFSYLGDEEGWPIDVKAAARAIMPEWYRSKIEVTT